MRLLRIIKHHALGMKPRLKAYNPRVGTCIIPLNRGDGELFYSYLHNKHQALSFEGSPNQLKKMVESLKSSEGVTVQKMKFSSDCLFLHLKTSDQQDLRRVIKML